MIRPMSCAAPAALAAVAMAAKLGRAGEAVDQRGAVEQHAGGQRAQHEVLEARLARAHVVAADGRHHVERQALQLEAEIERDQIVGRDHHHHAGGRQQHEHRVLELLRSRLAHVVEGEQQRARAGHEGEHLHEAAEAVDHEAAVEQRLPAHRLLEYEPRRQAQDHDGEPADGLRLAIVLGPEHAQHQQRHGADHQHDLRRDQVIARDQPAHGV